MELLTLLLIALMIYTALTGAELCHCHCPLPLVEVPLLGADDVKQIFRQVSGPSSSAQQ